ncbi:hypothetical protein [Aromatoleum evansii]|uniref:hypothetical protein n=1 Tax=Aromatoleum evansii TaxID=59406 RepID=UPI00145E78CD|nr:hypothetical protein [Aromatoleum evansii]NMG29568.1 hypothetical protein [Aromatoleum evansii]
MFEMDESLFPGFEVRRADDRQQLLVAPPEELLGEVMVFRSGASNPAEFNGYAAAGEPVGVVIGLLSGPMRERLRQHVDSEGGMVFVDSGVYSSGEAKQVDFGDVMSRYRQLVASVRTPAALMLVMPDKPGEFATTLDLLRAHRAQIAALHRTGAQLIVPLQRGADSIVSGYDAVREAVGLGDAFILGLPCKRHSFDLAEIRQLMRERQPARVHLLGVGADRKKLFALASAVSMPSPATVLTADSCRIRAMVGEAAPVTVATRAIRARAQRELGDIRPLLNRLWCDPAELMRAAQCFGQEFGYGDDETEIIGNLMIPGAYSLDELEWFVEWLAPGATPEERAAIARYWYERGVVFEEMHDLADELQRQFAHARQCAIEVVSTIEKSGARLSRSRTPMPMAA